MSITITKENIHQYQSIVDLVITSITWRAGSLDSTILRNFPNLLNLWCDGNRLVSLAGIECCSQLQVLACQHNQLVSLAGIEHCPHLRALCCFHNQLVSLAGIEHCPRLEVLGCSNNLLTSLAGIECCPQLQFICCSSNRLTSLVGIQYCLRLDTVDCSSNQLISLEHIVYLRNLLKLESRGNPLDVQTIQVQRFLARLNRLGRSNISKSVYSDGQNVHDVHIQKTVCDSIQRLMRDPKPEFSVDAVVESGLSQHTKELLIEYCSDESVHSVHLLTYSELLGYVWNRIISSPHRSELFRILEEQISDSECKCFTGRFNRTLSVLVGFCDDIVIEISDSSRIGAIILAVKYRLMPYDAHAHRTVARQELIAAGYTPTEIQPWLEAIDD